MFIILLLIVAVAAFNIVSTLVMAVTDKQPDIAILRTLGASPGGIMKIFVVQGALIGVIGTLLGVAGGVVLALNIDVVVPFLERVFSIQFLSREVYYITELPSDLQGRDVTLDAHRRISLLNIAPLVELRGGKWCGRLVADDRPRIDARPEDRTVRPQFHSRTFLGQHPNDRPVIDSITPARLGHRRSREEDTREDDPAREPETTR